MATYTWAGLPGTDWFTAADWLPGTTVPVTGDSVIINAGTAGVSGSDEIATVLGSIAELNPVNGEQITLGSTNSATPAAITATNALFGHTVSLTATGQATLNAIGPVGFQGGITASTPGTVLTINADRASGTRAADFVLLNGGTIAISNGAALALNGLVDLQATITIAAGSTLTNNGTVREFAGSASLVTGSILNGTGTFIVGPDDTMMLDTAVPSSLTIEFDGPGRINLGAVASFAGGITNFTAGSTIDLLNTAANSASLSSAGILTINDVVNNVATKVAAFQLQGPASGLMNTASDGSGGTIIDLSGSATRTTYEIDTADQALGANTVQATMTTAAGVPLNGGGIKIGIISDSFNSTITTVSNGVTTVTTDPETTAIKDGFLPASGAIIVQDSFLPNSEDEGLAMAELVHQIAPGATIYFASANGSGTVSTQTSFANAVNSLAADGVNIIVDDWSNTTAPFFQVAGPADAAVAAAMQSNGTHGAIDYFTDASNYDSAYYQASWNPVTAQIVEKLNGSPQTVPAQKFSNRTTYQTITVPAKLSPVIALQWDTAWPAAGGSVPARLGMALYDMNGNIIAQSNQILDTADGFNGIPEIQLTVPLSTTVQQYQVAIYQIGSTPVSQFKYIMFGGKFQSQNPGGTIDDPMAGIGSGAVHGWALVPGVNAVGASYWANSPAFGVPPDWTEFFSSPGPGQLLFTQNGTATNQIAGAPTFVAPDGIQTSVPGFQGFYGTSAATPNAAAVAALMLQANPALTNAQITSMLEQSAVSMGLPAADQGAGLIQAPAAVQLALNAGELALYTTEAALVTIDAFYNATPSLTLLNTVANATSGTSYFTAVELHNLGYSDTNVWTVLASGWGADRTSNFFNLYNGDATGTTAGYTAFLNAVYAREFGNAPSAANLQNLLADVPGTQALLNGGGHVATPIQVMAGLYGYLLEVGQTNYIGQYASSAAAFLQSAGTAATTNSAALTADPSTISVTGSDQLIDPGAGRYTIQFLGGAGADTLVLHPGSVDRVSGFDLNSDVLDLRSLLTGTGFNLTGNLAALNSYLTIAAQGADAVLDFAPTGQGGGSVVAVLQGLGGGVTSLDALLAHGVIRTGFASD